MRTLCKPISRIPHHQTLPQLNQYILFLRGLTSHSQGASFLNPDPTDLDMAMESQRTLFCIAIIVAERRRHFPHALTLSYKVGRHHCALYSDTAAIILAQSEPSLRASSHLGNSSGTLLGPALVGIKGKPRYFIVTSSSLSGR